MSSRVLTRRQMLLRGSSAFGGLILAGCDRLTNAPRFVQGLDSAESLTYAAQRWLFGKNRLAREYDPKDLSPVFRSNGTSQPDTELYRKLEASGFSQWRLKVSGLVQFPSTYSLRDLRSLPARTQITRHDCVEGWSAIGQWTGVPLYEVLRRAVVRPEARFAVFHCADELEEDAPYYESIDMIDAFHPQTMLAYELNGQALPVKNGAPLRLRVERQLGYKQAKYLLGIELVKTFADIGEGKGGFWEDRGYEWYAGI